MECFVQVASEVCLKRMLQHMELDCTVGSGTSDKLLRRDNDFTGPRQETWQWTVRYIIIIKISADVIINDEVSIGVASEWGCVTSIVPGQLHHWHARRQYHWGFDSTTEERPEYGGLMEKRFCRALINYAPSVQCMILLEWNEVTRQIFVCFTIFPLFFESLEWET